MNATYDALNRPLVVKNGAGAFVGDIFTIATPLSSSTFTYDPDNLAVDTETVSHDIDLNGTPELTRVLDRSRDSLGRSTGWELKNSTTVENSVAYDYGTTDGRLASISGGGLHPPSQFKYTYEPNSHGLIKTLTTHTDPITSPIHTVTNSWESTRNVLSSKENIVDTTNISTYQYGVNSLGQRTNVAQTGGAFAGVQDITWGYDSLGQVTKADHTLPALGRAYLFDGIGNRLKAAEGTTNPNDPSATLYTPTALNQYDAIGALNPDYDPDGNMTSGPLPAAPGENSVLEWDAENRLVEVQVGTSGPLVRHHYDAQSRRIATVSPGGAATLTIYDGWNPIAEYQGNVGTAPALAKTFTWGIDLSGSMQGAGGVGGLLAVTDSTGTYYPTYDGNGNVSEYLNSSGTVVAHYEYDPFGKTTVATGPKAQDFSHRFSTKPLDLATGFYYYGYRWYDPLTGRWPSRDPIGEEGGLNLYGFVGNSSVNGVDLYGLNELIISGGCNAHKGGWDGAAQASDGILGDPLRRGIRKVNPGIAHDRNWKNFITAAEKEIEERKGKLAKGEQIEWFVEWHSYARRAQLEGLDVNAYLKEIQEIAKKHEVALRFYGSKMEFIGKLHTSVFGNGYRTGNEKISRLTYFGHGRPGSLDFVYPGNQNGYSLFKEDIGMISKEVFSNHAIAISCACNSATATEGGGKSFRDVWKDHFGWEFYGVNSRTSYFKPESPTPTEGGNWVPSPPDGFE